MAERRRLDERRRRNPACDRLGLALVGGTGDPDLEHDGRAFAVCDDLPREIPADLVERRRERLVVAGDAARAVREQHDRIVRRAVAVDGDPVEAPLDGRAQERLGVALAERVVGRDTTSIVASRGWIIPAPFAMPPTVKPPPRATASLGPESVVRIALGRRLAAVGRELRRGGAGAGEHLVDGQRRRRSRPSRAR